MGAKQAAVRYASSVFPFHHVPSRYVCMVACGDRYVGVHYIETPCKEVCCCCYCYYSKEEVREAGRKGLVQPGANNLMGWDENSRELPDFCGMLEYFYKRVSTIVSYTHKDQASLCTAGNVD